MGTGDYFGPIVVTASYVSRENVDFLLDLKEKCTGKLHIRLTHVNAIDRAKALQKVNKNLSDKDAAKAAVTAFKFAKYTKELSKSLEDNKDILNKWAKSNKTAAELGTDTAAAVSEIQSSLEDMYGMKFSEDFVKKNFDTIKKAIDGDVKSLNQLDTEAAKEYIVNLDYTLFLQIKKQLK